MLIIYYYFSNYCAFPPLLFILGTKLKSACNMVTGCIIGLEIHRGKAGMALQQHSELSKMMACCLWFAEEIAVPGIREGFKRDAWFGSAKAVAELW